MTKPKQSLVEFAAEVEAERKTCHCDTLPEDVQEELIISPVSTAVAAKWLRKNGYEATGLDSWRRNKRAARGIQPG
jgi:hypothetical protein